MHVPIFDPREQQIVGRLDGAAQIGQQEVHSASHARLLSETRLADRSYPAALPKSSRPGRNAVKSPPKLARQSLANVSAARGKSGLHRAGCWVTPRRRKATNRATETSLVGLDVARERHVKVSFPRQGTGRKTRPLLTRSDNKGETRQPPPGATSNRRTTTWLAESAGRWLEPRGNPGPRGMTVHDRTRLNGQLHFFLRQRAARSTHSVIAATISGDSPSAGVTRNSVFAWRLRIFSTIAGSSRFRCAPCARKSGTMTTVSIPLPARRAAASSSEGGMNSRNASSIGMATARSRSRMLSNGCAHSGSRAPWAKRMTALEDIGKASLTADGSWVKARSDGGGG